MKTPLSQQLHPGDRVPNFVLPRAEGGQAACYDAYTGKLCALFFAGPPGAVSSAQLIESLRSAFGQDLQITLVFQGRPNDACEDRNVVRLVDAKNQITPAFGAPGLLILMDRNQQFLAQFDAGPGLERLGLPTAPAQPPEAPAPVLIINNLVDPDFRAELLQSWSRDHKEGRVTTAQGDGGYAIKAGSKRRLDHICSAEHNRRLKELVMRRAAPEAFKAFHFQTGDMQDFKIGAYEAGRQDFFRPHRDNSSPKTQHRKFALSINLNEDYEGGGVTFPEYGSTAYTTPAGGGVMFSCTLLHEALPVTSGTRFVELTFLFDRQAPAEDKKAQL